MKQSQTAPVSTTDLFRASLRAKRIHEGQNRDLVTDCDFAEPDAISNGPDAISNGPDMISNDRDTISNDRDAISNDRDVISNSPDVISNSPDVISNDPDAISNDQYVTSNDQDVSSNDQDAFSTDQNAFPQSRMGVPQSGTLCGSAGWTFPRAMRLLKSVMDSLQTGRVFCRAGREFQPRNQNSDRQDRRPGS